MKATARRTAEEATRWLTNSRVLGHRRHLGGRTLRRLIGGTEAPMAGLRCWRSMRQGRPAKHEEESRKAEA
jgi:hypothetical protein